MILLDTNVISEWMRPTPDPRVIACLDTWLAGQLFLPAVAKAEIEAGIALLPEGKRRTALHQAAELIFAELAGRCLPLDCDCTARYARLLALSWRSPGALLALSRRAGRAMAVEDAQIAAIAHRHGMALATRNLSDFDWLEDLELVDPWQEAAAG